MKASIRFYLDGKEDPKRIFASICYAGQRVRYFTGFRIDSVKFANQYVVKGSKGLEGKESIKWNLINDSLDVIKSESKKYFDNLVIPPTKNEVNSLLDNILRKAVKTDSDENIHFWKEYDRYIDNSQLSVNRKKQIRTAYNHLRTWEEVVGQKITFSNISLLDIRAWQKYLLKDACNNADKTTRDARGMNTVSGIFKCTRAFINWEIKEIMTSNIKLKQSLEVPINPFSLYEIPKEIYSDVIYLTTEERDYIASFDACSARLNRVRDMFVFQCLTGSRMGDLFSFTPNNIIDGSLVYVQKKKGSVSAQSVQVPLTETANDIIKRNKTEDRLFATISEVKYNLYLKELFKVAQMDRSVSWLNPRTRMNEFKPLHEVVSSHMGRKTFIGLLYTNNIKDDIICAMSGHKEGSRSFKRYRSIDVDLKKAALDKIDLNEDLKSKAWELLKNLSEDELKSLLLKIE